MPSTAYQVAAMLRRMDAYLHGESTEATAIIKDSRELIDVMAAIIGNRDHELQGLQDQIEKLTAAANVATLVAAHHAIEACKSATGQHRVIDHFVNKTSIAQEAQAAIIAAAQEAYREGDRLRAHRPTRRRRRLITLDAKTKTDSAESASTAGLGIIYGTRDAVAWAICAACEERPDAAGDARGNEKRWQDYLDVADAAIAAMAGGGVLDAIPCPA